MVACWNIHDTIGSPISRKPSHVDDKHAIVDAVFPFIQKDECIGWTRIHKIGLLAINAPGP